MKIRIEASSILRNSVTGVGYYTKSLIESFQKLEAVSVESFTLPINTPSKSVIMIKGISRRLYVKLHQFSIAPVFDAGLEQVDVTIFPDFALWPTKKSRINAVVIHDLTYMKYPQYMRMRTIGPFRLPVTTWYLSSVVRNAIKKADFIITVSESTKKDIINIFKINENRIVVTEIPPSSEFLSRKTTLISKSDLLKKYSIPTDDYILSVGTIEPRKNQISTLRSYTLLPPEARQRYSLVFAGGLGWSNKSFIDELHEAQEKGFNVILTGYFDESDSYALYRHASLYTSASYYEGFGMPVLEAMSAETPTILSNIPVYREIAADASIFIDPTDHNRYALEILNVLNDPVYRDKKVSNGIEALKKYSWEKNTARIINKVQELLAE